MVAITHIVFEVIEKVDFVLIKIFLESGEVEVSQSFISRRQSELCFPCPIYVSVRILVRTFMI